MIVVRWKFDEMIHRIVHINLSNRCWFRLAKLAIAEDLFSGQILKVPPAISGSSAIRPCIRMSKTTVLTKTSVDGARPSAGEPTGTYVRLIAERVAGRVMSMPADTRVAREEEWQPRMIQP